ncbi:MAG: hypothetical protein OXC80_12565 [Gammaproteobacteria bacterium]|nr:hypothetical protein [Gammaproteobacteria bacterium]
MGEFMEIKFVAGLIQPVSSEKACAKREALAECVLADDEIREICWSWILSSNQCTPRLSLCGEGLVGFYVEGGVVFLFIDEVKASSYTNIPGIGMAASGRRDSPRYPTHITHAASRSMSV